MLALGWPIRFTLLGQGATPCVTLDGMARSRREVAFMVGWVALIGALLGWMTMRALSGQTWTWILGARGRRHAGLAAEAVD